MNKKTPVNDTQMLKGIASSEDLNDQVKDKMLEMLSQKEELCLMDKIFGKMHPQIYISLIIVLLTFGTGIWITGIFKENIEIVKYIWQVFVPIITAIIGYIFGKTL